jgi:hypothetical protein
VESIGEKKVAGSVKERNLAGWSLSSSGSPFLDNNVKNSRSVAGVDRAWQGLLAVGWLRHEGRGGGFKDETPRDIRHARRDSRRAQRRLTSITG